MTFPPCMAGLPAISDSMHGLAVGGSCLIVDLLRRAILLRQAEYDELCIALL